MTKDSTASPDEAKAPKSVPEKRSPDEWAAAKGTKAWAMAGARQRFAWPIGALLAEAEFTAAIKAVLGIRLGSPGQRITRKRSATPRGKRWLSRA